jgi:hypothetical protein
MSFGQGIAKDGQRESNRKKVNRSSEVHGLFFWKNPIGKLSPGCCEEAESGDKAAIEPRRPNVTNILRDNHFE